ncbi:MAG: DUF3134 family protein [Leptolyngbyaceae cyanobacterium RU_5_1]|nr:DUF3134 family protein [Leptolyngbyaceae cyanobacterium RU_5_1]
MYKSLKRMVMMPTVYNPAFREEPRNQPIKVVPLVERETILSWLESTGRLQLGDEVDEFQDRKMSEDLDDFLDPESLILEDEEEELE